MRLLYRLVILLLAANLLLPLWNLLRPEPNDGRVLPPAFPAASLIHVREVSKPLLPLYVLNSTLPEGLQATERQSDCFMAGPFVSEEAAHIAMLGAGILYDVRSRRQSAVEAPLYRAMISPSADREEAQLRLLEVSAAIERIGGGIDTYVVTSGSIAHAVSLGLFSEYSNALNVQSLLAGQGVEVVIGQESRVEVGYWVVTEHSELIDFIGDGDGLDGVEAVPAELSENLCEMIAQAG